MKGQERRCLLLILTCLQLTTPVRSLSCHIRKYFFVSPPGILPLISTYHWKQYPQQQQKYPQGSIGARLKISSSGRSSCRWFLAFLSRMFTQRYLQSKNDNVTYPNISCQVSCLLHFKFETRQKGLKTIDQQAPIPEPVLAARHPLLSRVRPTRTNSVMASLPRSQNHFFCGLSYFISPLPPPFSPGLMDVTNSHPPAGCATSTSPSCASGWPTPSLPPTHPLLPCSMLFPPRAKTCHQSCSALAACSATSSTKGAQRKSQGVERLIGRRHQHFIQSFLDPSSHPCPGTFFKPHGGILAKYLALPPSKKNILTNRLRSSPLLQVEGLSDEKKIRQRVCIVLGEFLIVNLPNKVMVQS